MSDSSVIIPIVVLAIFVVVPAVATVLYMLSKREPAHGFDVLPPKQVEFADTVQMKRDAK